jgi:hypothetical protein
MVTIEPQCTIFDHGFIYSPKLICIDRSKWMKVHLDFFIFDHASSLNWVTHPFLGLVCEIPFRTSKGASTHSSS